MGNLFAKEIFTNLDSCENICVNDIQVLLDKYKENERKKQNKKLFKKILTQL